MHQNNPQILIVEDEAITRNMLKNIFEAEGYQVFEATDGSQMHEVLEQQTINLVIMDINLPGKNGLMLARELRETTEVALMFLTGRDNEIDKILEKFENEELSLDDSIAEYEKAIKLIKDSEKLLEVGEGKVLKVLEKNGKLETEEVE